MSAPSNVSTPPTARSAWTLTRWLAFFGLLTVLTWALLALSSASDESRGVLFLSLALACLLAVTLGVARPLRRIAWPQVWRAVRTWGGWIVIARLAQWGGIGCMALSAYLLRPFGLPDANSGALAFAIGLLLIGLSRPVWPSPSQRVERLTAAQEDKPRWRPVWAGLALIMLAIQGQVIPLEATIWPWFEALYRMSPHLQWLFLLGGAALIAYGLGGRWPIPTVRLWGGAYAAGWWVLPTILGLALGLRLFALGDWVTRWLDEVLYARAVAQLWYDNPISVLYPFSTVTSFSWLYPYIQSFSAALLGGLAGLRIISALFGVAQVAAIYLLARVLWPNERRLAWLSALFMATFPLHLHFSRIGIANIADPVWGTLALAGVIYGLRRSSRRAYILGGLALGLTQYFYEGGRLFYLPFVALFLGWLWLMSWPTRQARPRGRHILAWAGATLALALPLYYVWTAQGAPLVPRYQATSAYVWRPVSYDDPMPTNVIPFWESYRQRLELPARTFIQINDSSWFYGGQTAIVLAALVPLFLIGLGRAFWAIHTPPGGLIIWGMLGTVAGIALISDLFAYPRYLVALPFVVMALAWGALSLAQALHKLLKRGERLALACLVVLSCAYQASYYFFIHMPNFYRDRHYNIRDERGRLYLDTEDALLRAVTTVPNLTQVHIVSRDLIWDINAETFVRYFREGDGVRIQHVFPQDFTAEYLRKLSKYVPQAFFLEPHDARAIALLRRHFVIDPAQDGLGSSYSVPPERQMLYFFAPPFASLGEEDGVRIGQ
ncbi:MAG: hypothetical protein NZ750_06705 [Anaerolineae bacterium]|nr:hypothetical protein [Anaerolineae bacterium]MDW8171179.1 hypothetical protein [Anaerolineae bacterium]